MVSAAALPAGLRTVSTKLTAVLTVVAVAITCASYKRILSAQKITSFADFGEAPLHYMSFYGERTLIPRTK